MNVDASDRHGVCVVGERLGGERVPVAEASSRSAEATGRAEAGWEVEAIKGGMRLLSLCISLFSRYGTYLE